MSDAIIDGQAPALPDEQMEAINLTWAEVLASARWTYKQWSKALDREQRMLLRLGLARPVCRSNDDYRIAERLKYNAIARA